MPRPSITMVLHRSSRSSRVPPATSGEPSHEPSHERAISPPPSDGSVEKRIRKPSQRMLEALQDDTEGTSEKPVIFIPSSPTVSKGKRPKRHPSPSTSPMADRAESRSKRSRTSKDDTQVTDDATPEAVLGETSSFAAPEEKMTRKKTKRNSEVSLSETKRNSETSLLQTGSQSGTQAEGRGKGQLRNRTKSNFSDDSIPSASEEEEEEEEETSTVTDEESPKKQKKKLKTKTAKGSPASSNTEPPTHLQNEEATSSKGSRPAKVLKTSKTKSSSKRKPSLTAEEAESFDDSQDAGVPEGVAGGVAEDDGSVSFSESLMMNDRRLTARQRAKLYGAEEHLIKLEDPKAKTPPADFLEKKEERNKKRREQASVRREELKTETVQKLLHKTPNVKKNAKSDDNLTKKLVKYVINELGTSIFYPEGAITIEPMLPISVPVAIRCGVAGCKNPKKYCCSKTGLPLCSLECYKKSQSRRGSPRVK